MDARGYEDAYLREDADANSPTATLIESMSEQLAECELERGELIAALVAVEEQLIDGHMFPAVVDMNAWHTKVINALAKVGAGKTGEGS